MGKKGHRSKLGRGELWKQPKDRVLTIKLTATGKQRLDEYAQQLNISRGELIERFARGLVEAPKAVEPSSLTPIWIIEQLPSLKFGELIEVGKAVLDALDAIVLAERSSSIAISDPSISIASLIKEQDFQKLAEESCLAIEDIERLSEGGYPTDEQIIGLSRAMDIDPEQLLAIRRRLFGNGNKIGDSMVP